MQIEQTDIEDPAILALIKENLDVIQELSATLESYQSKSIYIEIILEMDLVQGEEDVSTLELRLSKYPQERERLYGTVREWDEDQDLGSVTFKP